MTTATTRPGAGRREWVGLALLGLPVFLVSMDFSVLYLGVPHLTADLAPDAIQQLWIVDIYGFLIAGSLVTMGTIGDRIGRKKLLLIGAVVFGVVSVAAAFSTSPQMLIASRALLGVAGAAVMPSVLALVTGMFTDPRQRSRALAIYLTCFMGGATLGPLVGGLLLEYFWWGSVFLVSVPGIVLLLAFGPFLLPDQKAPRAGTLDPVSVALSLTAILPFIYGLKELARHGWEWLPALALMFGVTAGLVFVRRQRRLEHPLLDLRMFGNRTFSSALTLMFVTSMVGTGTLLASRKLAEQVDRGCPMPLGGPLPHVIAAKAVAFAEASTPAFSDYARRVDENSAALAHSLLRRGGRLVTGGSYARAYRLGSPQPLRQVAHGWWPTPRLASRRASTSNSHAHRFPRPQPKADALEDGRTGRPGRASPRPIHPPPSLSAGLPPWQ